MKGFTYSKRNRAPAISRAFPTKFPAQAAAYAAINPILARNYALCRNSPTVNITKTRHRHHVRKLSQFKPRGYR